MGIVAMIWRQRSKRTLFLGKIVFLPSNRGRKKREGLKQSRAEQTEPDIEGQVVVFWQRIKSRPHSLCGLTSRAKE